MSRNVSDILFEGCDALERGLAAIEGGEADGIDAGALIGEMARLLGERPAEGDVRAITELTPGELALADQRKAEGLDVVRVMVLFDPKNSLKNAKAQLLVRDLGKRSELLHLSPSEGDIKQGKLGTELSIVLATKEAREGLQKAVSAVYGVRQALLLDPEQRYETPHEHAHAEKEGKRVELAIEGADTEFDRTVLNQIGEPLVHLLWNSVDHGIEPPAERVMAGKQEQGEVKLTVRRERNHAVLELSDDGQGIDHEAVKASCLKKGIVTEAEVASLSLEELRMLIFRPGISTSTVVTEASGRGVGMMSS